MPPSLPPAHELVLPGRGRTWVYDSGPPQAGGGPPLVLLHGWTSTAALNFYRCFPALTPRYRVVALDHRGHGRGVRSRLPFRLEDCADDVAALIECLDLGPSTVVGYSMGGPIAQLTWRRHPEAVAGLVLCATAARFPIRRFNGAGGTAAAGLAATLSLIPQPVRRTGMAYATARWSASGDAARWAAQEWGRHDPSALLQAGVAISRFDSTPWLGAIDVPTAVVVTEHDRTVPPRRQRQLADSVPGAVSFPVAADHRAVAHSPRAFLPALLEACASVQSRAAAEGVMG
ncbi:MAG TPA: alpha/beta fold hydrolase [Acidimicrobiales bacterium]|nr:alpha/beta fold hydrolase [Acidimicrobiales bacterium]